MCTMKNMTHLARNAWREPALRKDTCIHHCSKYPASLVFLLILYKYQTNCISSNGSYCCPFHVFYEIQGKLHLPDKHVSSANIFTTVPATQYALLFAMNYQIICTKLFEVVTNKVILQTESSYSCNVYSFTGITMKISYIHHL